MGKQEVQVVISGNATSLFKVLEDSSKALESMAAEMAALGEGVAKVFSGFAAPVAALSSLGIAVHEVAEFVEHAVENTNRLTEAYEGLSITAGLTVDEFNKIHAAASLVGGTTEDVIALVGGMEKGIKRNTDVLIANGVANDKVALSHLGLEEYIHRVVEVMQTLGSATEKDQLLMSAFGKSGMQFADLLVEMNEHMARAKELTKDGGILDEKLLTQMKRHREEVGEYNITLKEYEARVASQAVTWTDLWHNFKTFTMHVDLAQSKVQDFVSRGLIQYKVLADGVNADNASMVKSVNELIERWKLGTEQSKDFMDAGAKAGFGKLPTKTYISKDDLKEQKESELSRLEALLEQKKFLYEKDALERGQYLQFTKAMEVTFWHENMNDAALDAQGRLKVEKLYFEAKRAAMLESHKEEFADAERRLAEFKNDAQKRLDIAIELETKAANPEEKKKARDAQAKILAEIQKDREKAEMTEIATQAKHQEALLDLGMQFLTHEHEMGTISDQQFLDAQIQIEEKKFKVALQGLQDRLQLLILEGDKRKEEAAKLNAEIQALMDKHNAAMAGFGMQQADLTRQQDGWAGWSKGIADALKQGQNAFEIFKQAASSVMNGVTNAFATGISGILSGQMSLRQGLKSIWQGIVQTVITAVAQIIAQWVVVNTVGAFMASAQTAQSATKTGAYLTEGAAGAWAAYGWIPYVGAALALAQIALMETSVAAVGFSGGLAGAGGGAGNTGAGAGGVSGGVGSVAAAYGRSVGGRVDRPELTMLGENGPEIVAPESTFMDWAANLEGNIMDRQSAILAYNLQSSGYASAARSGAPNGVGQGSAPIHVHLHGPVMDTSDRGRENLGNYVIDAVQVAARRRGQVIQPGLIFGMA